MSHLPLLPPFIPGHRWRAALGEAGGWVYCRYSVRPVYGQPSCTVAVRTLDIADAEVAFGERGQGVFSTWLADREAVCGPDHGIQALYVENVLNARLAAFFRRRPGWTERVHRADPEGRCPCFQYLP